MKAYISDSEDLKLDPSYQETWDDMIINVSVPLRNMDLSIYYCFSFFLTRNRFYWYMKRRNSFATIVFIITLFSIHYCFCGLLRPNYFVIKIASNFIMFCLLFKNLIRCNMIDNLFTVEFDRNCNIKT